MPTEDHHINTLDDVKVNRLFLICMIINIVMMKGDYHYDSEITIYVAIEWNFVEGLS